MKILSKTVFLIVIIAVISSFYMINQEAEKQKNYEKCVSVCSTVAGNVIDAVKECMSKCEEKFLGGAKSSKGL